MSSKNKILKTSTYLDKEGREITLSFEEEFNPANPLGSGSSAKVYPVIYHNPETNLGENYVLKVFDNVNNKALYDGEYNELKENPYFETVRQLEFEGKPTILMKRIPGISLADKRFRELSLLERLKVWKAVLVAASLLPYQDKVHFDLKPENIFYDFATNKAIILDMGSAKKMDTPLTDIKPTWAYAAHELYSSDDEVELEQRVHSGIDSFALGVIGYELFGSKDALSVLKETFPEVKNSISFDYKLTQPELHAEFTAKQREVLENNKDSLGHFVQLETVEQVFESIHKTQSHKITDRPSIVSLLDTADDALKAVRYAQISELASKVDIFNKKVKNHYQKLWDENKSDTENTIKLFDNYIAEGLKFFSNRHHLKEIHLILKEAKQNKSEPLVIIQKIYLAINKKKQANFDGEAMSRLRYLIHHLGSSYKLSPSKKTSLKNTQKSEKKGYFESGRQPENVCTAKLSDGPHFFYVKQIKKQNDNKQPILNVKNSNRHIL